MDPQSISVSCHVCSFCPLLTFSLAYVCAQRSCFRILSWGPMYSSACASKDSLSLATSAFVWKDLRAGMSMFVTGCIQTVSSVQDFMGKARKRFSCSFLNSLFCLHGCYFGTPATSSCSYPCSMTVLKDYFGLIVGTDYWGEIHPRHPRKEDTGHSPQKGFFVLLSQLPCSSLVVFSSSWKYLHFLSAWCLGHLLHCPSHGVALCNAGCKQEALSCLCIPL